MLLKYKKIALPIYIGVMAVLGVLMFTTEHFRVYAYLSVITAFLMNLAFLTHHLYAIMNAVALLFTLGADYLLVVRGDNYPVAMVLFSIAQLSYAARIWVESREGMKRVELISRIIVGIITVLVPPLLLGAGADFLAVISVFYFGQLILNCVFALIGYKRSNILLFFGFLLFLFCDIFVGFGNLSGYLPIEPGTVFWWMAHPPINMAWVFYLPSQTLLGMSLAFNKEA